ncbi:MAG TPA: carboxypeptidase-like regulatory domain-containing protein [Candidatus Solibacter sp.]|nr:carboxypeptidase-like regulatory domain-containing protein [Candidatus Solibacter sp.]
MAKLLWFLILPAACAAQSVEGTVLNAGTSAGAAGVTVALLKGTTAFYETTTDGAGHFRFDNIREADYSIRYRSPDYWLAAGESDYRPFHVAAGSPVKIEARLMPWSRISGRVVDARRNGVAKAQLQLTGPGITINGRTYLRTSWGEGGGGQLSDSVRSMTYRGVTDAEGKFEVRVMPGTYGLTVDPPLDLKPPAPAPEGPPLVWTRTYYQGATLAEGASKITLLPGGEVADVELKLQAVPAYAVRGVALNPDGTPAAKATITLRAPPRAVSAESNADGAFELPDAAEGEWLIMAEMQRGAEKIRATQVVEITKHDLEGVKLRLVAPFSIPVKVVMDAPKDGPMPRLGPFVLSRGERRPAGDSDLGMMAGALLTPDAKGNLSLQAYPGVYRFEPQLQLPAPSYYLDAIRVGEADLIMRDAEISADTAITVVYKNNGGWVRGKVENCASGGVLLVPSDPAMRGRGFSKSAPCDAKGYYEVLAVRPGDYYALAVAGNGPVPVVDDALLGRATKVTVRAGEGTSADLLTITKPVF